MPIHSCSFHSHSFPSPSLTPSAAATVTAVQRTREAVQPGQERSPASAIGPAWPGAGTAGAKPLQDVNTDNNSKGQ